MTPCFDLNERKEKTKKHLKTLTALGLICLLLPSVHAEDALKKEDNSIPKDSSQNFVKDKIAAPVFEEKPVKNDIKKESDDIEVIEEIDDAEDWTAVPAFLRRGKK